MNKLKTYIRKNDRVMVRSGRDKGKAGKVKAVMLSKGRALVEGINIVKKHQRHAPGIQGGILEKEASIHLSNLMLICPKCTDPVRIGKKILEDGTKVRVCKKCGEVVPIESK